MTTITKKRLSEIIDSNGDLIGKDDIPKNGSNLETQANNTTDYNAQIGQQPFRYDMLGRFGFTLTPFMEGKEDDSHKELMEDLVHLMHENRMEVIEYYYRNPNKLKPDFRKSNEGNQDVESDKKWAENVANVLRKHLKGAFKFPENLDENKVVEDKVIEKKVEDEITKKGEDKEVRQNKIEKIAGLINKLEKKDIDKLINLLERNG